MRDLFDVLVTDVDGVLTPGNFFYTADGKVMKEFGPHDSDGVRLLHSMGISVIAITADKRGYPITKKRMDDMGVQLILVTEDDRFTWFKEHFNPEKTAFVGDGFYDAPVLGLVEYSFSPADATQAAKDAANYNLDTRGGRGVLLEIALFVQDQLT